MSIHADSVFETIRQRCALVTQQAEQVKLCEKRLVSYADALLERVIQTPTYDTRCHFLGDATSTALYIVVLDAVNFGSAYFSALHTLPVGDGYFTIAAALKQIFELKVPTAAELEKLSLTTCADWFQQPLDNPQREKLMQHFTVALNQLGSYLLQRFDGDCTAFIAAAEHSAAVLVSLLTEMPCFQDVATYRGLNVPFYKRAQIMASDLALALNGQGMGYFADLHHLTLFADNLVPHVLWRDGVLTYSPELVEKVMAQRPLIAGSAEEVEIRAVALHTVEQLSRIITEGGKKMTARDLDILLWNRGQSDIYQMPAGHCCETVFY